MTPTRRHHLTASGRAAVASVTADDTEVDVHFHIRAGQLAPGTRARIVARVFALPELRDRKALRATVPLGDAELLHQLRRRCTSLSARAAGATCLVDADLGGAR